MKGIAAPLLNRLWRWNRYYFYDYRSAAADHQGWPNVLIIMVVSIAGWGFSVDSFIWLFL